MKDPFSLAAQHALSGRTNLSRRATPDAMDAGTKTPAAVLTARPDNMYTPFVPLLLRIEYHLDNLRDGFTFVGCEPGDMRYPHAYTTNTPSPGAACCIFPTLDGIHERWTWELEITVPRTIGDIERAASSNQDDNTLYSDINAAHEGLDAEMAEDRDLDMMVVCSGDFIDEVFAPQ
jgi:transcription initiation factor TFIID subunit 2